jgi:hypothetical protein
VSPPNRVETKTVASTAVDSELVRLFAVLSKASFAYQENSRRTIEAFSGFQVALLARVQETGTPFVLENRSDGLYTETGIVPTDILRDWLRSIMQRALLGAICFEGAVNAKELQKFLAHLRVTSIGKIRKDATFQALWPERFGGLELRELRFFGGYHQLELHSGAGARSLLATMADSSVELRAALQRLDLSDAQLQRILALEQRLTGSQTAAEDGELLSLPGELLAALPIDVVDDPAARPMFVERLLDRLEKELDDLGQADNDVTQTRGDIVELFRKLPQTLITSDAKPGARPDVSPLPSQPHRPEDRAGEEADEIEDPSRLVPLVAALPEKTIDLEPNEAVLQAETLRVCLHQLGAEITPRIAAPAAAKVRKILGQAAPEALHVLEHYVIQALSRNSKLPSPEVVDRLLLRLDHHQLLPELRRQGGLTVQRITRHFPKAFVPFLKSLSADSAADVEVLVQTLKGLEETSLAAGVEELLRQQEILNPAMLRKLFGMGGRSALGLARHMLHAPHLVLREEVITLLRGLSSVHAEGAPLVFLEAGSLPVLYLQQLCDFERTGKPNPRLRNQAGWLLYTYIEATPNDAHLLASKAQAITGLGVFPGPSSESLLKQQLRGHGLLGPFRVPKPIRDAVRAVRARWREDAHV